MTPQEYILSTLEKIKTPIQMEDIGNTPIEDAIYAKVMSKKFRKLKPGDDAVRLTRNAIKLFVKENKPIKIFEMFGGNKLWRFEEAPEIDWAELFSLTYFMQWSRLIASVYEPGVHFEYFSQDISVESLNNIPRSETDRYSETFIEMLEFVRPYLPKGVTVTYKRLFDEYKDPNDYYKELEDVKKQILAKNNGNLPKMDKRQLAVTELNVKTKPGQTDDPLWKEKVELEHQAIYQVKTIRKFSEDPYKIWTCPTYYSDSVVTGSTKHSYAKFWAGVGALKQEDDSFAELVLTPKQLAATSFTWEAVNIPGLKGKNFKRVRIVK